MQYLAPVTDLTATRPMIEEESARFGSGKVSPVFFPSITDQRGSLTPVELETLPFVAKRLFFLTDLAPGESRGRHANFDSQLIVLIAGRLVVQINDGRSGVASYELERPGRGLIITPLIWREIHPQESGAACLVLSDSEYSDDLYLRDFEDFRALVSAS